MNDSLPFPLADSKRASGFTLIELLAVVLIIAILVAITIPAYFRVMESAKQAECASNLRAIGTGIASYIADNDGTIPAGYSSSTGVWTTALIPYMPWSINYNSRFDVSRYCPTTSNNGLGIYKRNASTWGTDYGVNQVILVSSNKNPIKASTVRSNVFTVFDGNQIVGWPSNGIYYRHQGKVNVLFLDGHVESFTEIPEIMDPRWGRP